MANRRPASEVEEVDFEDNLPEEIVVNDDLVSARVKGTWLMTWGPSKFDFVDGKRYRLPRDLYHYLKERSCIYDTL